MKTTYQDFIQNILDTRGRFACGDEYCERHHIVPRCMGGLNNDDNLIDLYAREHFEAHRLLALENPNIKGLTYAWWIMSTTLDGTKKEGKVTPEEYEECRKVFSKSISGENNPMYGKPSPRRGAHLTAEQKQHLREINFGELSPVYDTHLSNEAKEKIRLSHIGKVATDEAKENMSKAHIGKNMGADSGRAKQIAQYDTDGNLIKIWDCLSDAAREYNVTTGCIYNACSGKNKTAAGYQFRYVEKDIVTQIEPYVNQCGKYQSKTIARCDEDWNIIDIWEGCAAASLGTGISRTHIGQCCNKKRQSAGGYKWKILNDNKE